MPRRIQCRRTKGWCKPEGAIYIGRGRGGNGLGRWGNPYRIGATLEHVDGTDVTVRDAPHAVELFDQWLEWQFAQFKTFRPALIAELGGHDLACWCPEGAPCHGDVYLRVANP